MSSQNVVMVCRDKQGNVKYVDRDMCYRPYRFLPWKPEFKCGDKNNRHTCEPITPITEQFLESLKYP